MRRDVTYTDWDKPVRIMCRCCNQQVKVKKEVFNYTVNTAFGSSVVDADRLYLQTPCGKGDYWYPEAYRQFCATLGTGSGPEYELDFINGRYYIDEVPVVPKCECGAHKTGSKMHSHWCPMVHERTK